MDDRRKEFEAAAEAAEDRYQDLRHERGRRLDKAVDEARARVVAETPEVEAALAELQAAQERLLAERDRIARLGTGGKYPVGTKVELWGYPRRGRYGRGERELMARGVVEAFTTDSVQPDSQRWGRAKVGDWVVRRLLKDGTPGKVVEVFRGDDLPYEWRVST